MFTIPLNQIKHVTQKEVSISTFNNSGFSKDVATSTSNEMINLKPVNPLIAFKEKSDLDKNKSIFSPVNHENNTFKDLNSYSNPIGKKNKSNNKKVKQHK